MAAIIDRDPGDETHSDPRPPSRVRDKPLLSYLHLVWDECVLCRKTSPLSLHHISKHPRDDMVENIVMLCGDGVSGCHGKIEARDIDTCKELAEYIRSNRKDTMVYLTSRFGDANVWLERHLYG